MTERTFSVTTRDGRTLTGFAAGARSGHLVISLHGTPMSALLYGPHEQDAAHRGLRLVGYDRPGYGGSTPQPGRSIIDAAADVAAIADHFGAERFGVWGISGGGPHALACAARLPKRAAAVVALAAPAPYPAKGLDWLANTGEANLAEFRASLEGSAALESFLEPLRREYLDPNQDAADAALASLLTPLDRAAYSGDLKTFLHESARRGLLPGVAGWRDDDLAFAKPWGFELSEIRVPLTLWQGRQDLFVPYAHGKWLGDQIGHAVRNLSDEDGHLTLYQHRIPAVHSWIHTYLVR